ncbi:MAG: hypothetical protein RL354_698 [Planctomycetota bacterium]|jgi:uncharacterized membrane protein YoaK (UPF0700 family)
MIAHRAHTFILQARLAISLAWVAGYVNLVALATCGTMVSHLTGHGTALGRELVDLSWWAAALTAVLFAAFFGGAFLSGFAVELGRQRNWASLYVLPAAIELVLLAVFAVGVRLHDPSAVERGATLWWMTVVATAAMGVQNATITRISSGVVRTTHLTGIVTDLGHESAQLAVVRWLLGRGARAASAGDSGGRCAPPGGRGPSYQRLVLLASILGAFVAGGVSAAIVYREAPHWSMAAPIALLAWIIVADLRTPICEIEEARLEESDAGLAVMAGVADVAVFRVIGRGGGREAHLPDLAAWVDGLPEDKRVVILDLGHVRAFGPLAANALHALMAATARTGRRAIVAGIDGVEMATINALSRSDLLNEHNSAPDLGGALRVAAESAADGMARARARALGTVTAATDAGAKAG